MRFFEALGLALSSIKAHKLRSFLTLLGIIFGVATVIVVVSLIEGFNKYVDEKIADLGSNAFIVNKMGMVTSLQEWIDRNKKNKDIKLDDLRAIQEHPVYVRDAAAMMRRRSEVKRGTQTLQDVEMMGASYNMIDIDTVKIGQGRYISHDEDEHSRYTCFVGYDIVNKFFPSVDPLDKEIKIDGRPFRIVGVAQEIGSVFGNPRDGFVIVPISTFQNIYGSRGSISIRVAATTPDTIVNAQDEVRVILRGRRHLNYDDPDNFGIVTSDGINNLRAQIFGTVSIVTVGITSIALVVGGIVIMNMMLVSVTERTREIGLRKSLGARRRDILKQFLAESTALSLFGGCVGVAMAYGLAKLGTLLFSLPTALPIFWTIMALTVSASIGLFFGIYPAYKAARLDPIEALRAD
ncbi:MAG TPA: ABC transporter permease [Blastocatellia bacterium]|jgi:putative ABC transport system permease protein|nr:ABC transporter permease [Blastocatellia bacterium]